MNLLEAYGMLLNETDTFIERYPAIMKEKHLLTLEFSHEDRELLKRDFYE